MAGGGPELRLADGALELGPAVCAIRRGGRVEEITAGEWEPADGGLRSSAGPITFRLQRRRRRGSDQLVLTASAGAQVAVETLGVALRPAAAAPAPAWLLYDGYQSWDAAGIAPLAGRPTPQTSWWRCGLARPDGGGVALAAQSAARQLTRFSIRPGEVRWLQAAPPLGQQQQPVWLTRDTREFTSEPLRIAAGPDVRSLLGRLLPPLARRDSPAPRGWLSWYHLGIFVDAAAVLANAELLAARVPELGRAVVQIDDGWQLAYGDWTPNTKFPDLGALCQDLQARGQVPGIWTAPFLVSAAADVAVSAPESWFLRDPATGERLTDPRHTVFGPMHVLDLRETAVRRHLTRVFRRLREQGFQHFKIDFLYAGAYAGLAAFRAGLAAIRRGAGGDAYLLACGAPLLPVAGLVDGCRIGPDTCTPWLDFDTGEPQPTFFGDEVVNVVRNVAARADLRPLFQTDPDVAVAGGTLSTTAARQLITAVALCGGLYFLSDDLRTLAAERFGLAAHPALPAIAAGLPARPDWEPSPADRPPAVWRRDDLVAVFNFGPEPLERTVAMPAGRTARDVWSGERVVPRDRRLTLAVEPQGVRLIRFEGG